MKKYTSNVHLVHNGNVLAPNSPLELSDVQYSRLGDKVKPVQDVKEKAEERVADKPKKKTKKG